jgi:hypothetical protein
MQTYHTHNWDGGPDIVYAVPDSIVNEFLQYILTDRRWPRMQTNDEFEMFVERCLRFRKKVDSNKVLVKPGEKIEEVEMPEEELPPMALERDGDPVAPVKRPRGRPRKVIAA